MKKIISVVICGCILFGQMTFTACNNEKELIKLPVPQNFALEAQTITWDEVPHAVGYALVLGDAESEVSDTSFVLPEDLETGKHELQILAVGDLDAYDDSDWTSFSFDFISAYDLANPIDAGYDDLGLQYNLLEDKSGYEVSKGKAGKNLAGTLMIPSTFRGIPVKRIADYGFSVQSLTPPNPFTGANCNAITTDVILPSTIEEIGKHAFAYMLRLEEISLPDSVKTIGPGAFMTCIHLRHVKFPSGLKEIPGECFQKCALEELDLPNGLESIGSCAFSEGSDMTDMLGVPFYEHNLTKVIIPASVKVISPFAFTLCSNLEEVIFQSTENIEEISYMCFTSTKWLLSQPKGFVMINDILLRYTGTEKSVRIPDTVRVIEDEAFSLRVNGTSITSVYIPDSVQLIGQSVFYNCQELADVRLPAGLTEIPASCFHGTVLETITLPETVQKIGYGAFSWSGFGAPPVLSSIRIPDKVTVIGRIAFQRCVSLTEVIFGENSSLTTIGDYAFRDCSMLKTIEIPKTVTYIGASVFDRSRIEDGDNFCIRFRGTTQEWLAIEKAQTDEAMLTKAWDYGMEHYTVVCTDGTIDETGAITPN